MSKAKLIVGVVVAIALFVLLIYAREHIHFDWGVFVDQIKRADWKLILLGIGLIYGAYALRAVRWALFLKPVKRVSPFRLIGSQVIGFTGVALLGRPADLVRPYLVSRRVNLPLSSQVAVYLVERMFDLGAMALLFSVVLLSARGQNLPHPELLFRIAKGSLVLTVALAVFAVAVRISGGVVAAMAEKVLGSFSEGLGRSVGEKIRAFRSGLDTLRTWGDAGLAAGISLIHWGMITGAYLATARAFTASPQLSGMTLARCMVLMAASMAASSIQLPVLGWFTQIGITSTAMQRLFNVAWEPALGCGAALLLVTFLSVVPVGLIWARFEHVSLKKVAEESEHAAEESAPAEPLPERS